MSEGVDTLTDSTALHPERGRRRALAQDSSLVRIGGWLRRLLVEIPDRLALVLLWASVVVMALILLKQFNPLLAAGLTAALVLVTWRFVPDPVEVDQRSTFGSVVAIEFVMAWVWVNAPYYSQMVSVNRDPAIYALRGFWLMHHRSPDMNVAGAVQGIQGVPLANVSVGGFPIRGNMIYPQGGSLLPGFLAVAGRAGTRALLGGNLLIGGAALLIVYGLARRIVGPLWGLVAMMALAVSMPMVYFSRATYTEPTAMAAVFGGLILVISALRSRRMVMYAAAGALVGVSAMARIDGLLAVCGAVFGLGLAATFARDAESRRTTRIGMLLFAVAGIFMAYVGFYDIAHNSPSYFHSEHGHILPLFKLAAAVTVFSLLLTLVPLGALRRWVDTRRGPLGRVAFVAILVASAVMASRPLWWIARFNVPTGFQSMTNRQQAEGLPIDPKRSYEEHSVSWLAWYLGWPVVICAAVGLALMGLWLMTKRDLRILVPLATFAAVSVFYLNRLAITPDQIWASRRLLPVIMPGVVIAAAVVPMWLALRKERLWLAGAVAVLLVIFPAAQWRNLFEQPEFQNELNGVVATCQAIDKVAAGDPNKYVVLAGPTPGSGPWTPTLIAMCGATAVQLHDPSPANMMKLKQNWGGKPVAVITFDDLSVTWKGIVPPLPAYTSSIVEWQQPLLEKPSTVTYIGNTFWLGSLASDGTVSPL